MGDLIHKTKRQSTYCMHAQLLQSCATLYDPMDCSLPESSVHGIPQSRILEWVVLPSSRDLPNPGIKPRSLALQGGFCTDWNMREAHVCLYMQIYASSIISVMSDSRGSSQPTEPWGKPMHAYTCIYMQTQSFQSSLTLYDPMDCSPPGSSVHETFQARILEWIAIPFSRCSSQ